MDELTKYIFDWCPNLLTGEELSARKHLIGLQKVKNAESVAMKNMLRKKWLSKDENVLKLLENGSEKFYKKAVERVLKDNPNKEFLNLCPKCNALTKKTKAKQCPKCYFSWHNQV